jgi:hypothetical protein
VRYRSGCLAAGAAFVLLVLDPSLRGPLHGPAAPSSNDLPRRRDDGAAVPIAGSLRRSSQPREEKRAFRAIESALSTLESAVERRVRKSVLALIAYPWPDLGYEVAFMRPRPGFRAMTISDRRRIEIYVHPGESPLVLAYDLAHEIGHAFDLEHNDAERRRQWRLLRGIDPEVPWFGCNRCPDYDTPAGDFAETFAYLLLGPGSYHSRIARPPSDAEIPRLAEFCRIAAPRARYYDAQKLPGREPVALHGAR